MSCGCFNSSGRLLNMCGVLIENMFPDFVFFPLWSSLITGCDLDLLGLLNLNILFRLA